MKNIEDIKYDFCSSVHDFGDVDSQEDYSRCLSRCLFDEDSENGFSMIFDFPKTDKTVLPSQTIMNFYKKKINELTLETIHCYPHEEVFVKTQTRIEI